MPADELGRYFAAVADGSGLPHEVFQVLANPAVGKIDQLTFYLAELDGVPVGTGMTAITNDVTGIFDITTLPRYRRRGYGRAVTMEMVRAGYAADAPTAYLNASEMGQSVFESVGFGVEEYPTVFTAP